MLAMDLCLTVLFVSIFTALSQKADVAGLRRVEDQMRQLAMTVSQSQGIGSDELHKFRRELLHVVDGKADGKHVAALVDQKVNVVDMNEALNKLSAAIQTNSFNNTSSVKEDRVEVINKELMALHSRMNAEYVFVFVFKPSIVFNVLSLTVFFLFLLPLHHFMFSSLCARWIWKSGTLAGPPSAGVSHPGELVPWNIECTNANPAVFRWSSDASTIGADLPGLYEIRVGMFTDKQPRVCILVNGHAVFSTPTIDHFGSGGTVHARKANRRQQILLSRGCARNASHPAGNVSGWSLLDFLALPAHSEISVLYHGPKETQGFLSLRKL